MRIRIFTNNVFVCLTRNVFRHFFPTVFVFLIIIIRMFILLLSTKRDFHVLFINLQWWSSLQIKLSSSLDTHTHTDKHNQYYHLQKKNENIYLHTSISRLMDRPKQKTKTKSYISGSQLK